MKEWNGHTLFQIVAGHWKPAQMNISKFGKSVDGTMLSNSSVNDNNSILKHRLSQQASGACNASQFPPDRLVLSTTNVVVEYQLVNIRQHIIVPNSLRFTSAVGSSAVGGSLCRFLHDMTHCWMGQGACILVFKLTTKPCKPTRLHQLASMQELQAPTPAGRAQDASSALHAVHSLLQSAYEEVDSASSAASSITQAQADLRDLMDKASAVPVSVPLAASDQQLNSSLAGTDNAEMFVMLFCT